MANHPAPSTLGPEVLRQVEALRDRLQADWAAGRRPALESFLGQVPNEGRPLLLRELLKVDLDYRGRAGQPPSQDDYRRRFGHLGTWVAPLLAELFAAPAERFCVTLTVTEGPHRGAVFTFTEHDTFLVGRAPEAHFALPDDPYFSRMHFLVEVNPPLCRLVDMHSRNGTHVNGARVPVADLKNGDLLQGGHTTLQVALELPVAARGAETLSGDHPGLRAQTRVPPEPVTQAPPSKVPPGAGSAAPSSVLQGIPVSESQVDLPRIPGYQVHYELGRGGMGVVYFAHRQADSTPVALKTVLPAAEPTPVTVARFLREADILRQLQHPHIVAFRDMGEVGGLLYFAMDFVEGTDAGQILKVEGPLPVGRAVGWVCQLLEALAYAHERGFVHRDIKPSNLLIAKQGGREVVKVADFGLARAYQASPLSGLTMTGASGGTPAYMPPEQILDFRKAQPPADQYAAAVTLYQLLTARTLFDGATSPVDLFLKVLQDKPVPIRDRRPDLPAALGAIIHKALAHKAEERYPDSGELRRVLLPFGGE